MICTHRLFCEIRSKGVLRFDGKTFHPRLEAALCCLQMVNFSRDYIWSRVDMQIICTMEQFFSHNTTSL